MIGSFLTRGLVMIFGYAYPAYECYKTVERNKPDIEQLRFWCQYWILVAFLTVSERIADTFISWVPMYSEAKLAFYIYLWYPKTKGTAYVYDAFFRPYVAKHETDIDRNLLELKTRAGDYAILYWQKAAKYAQTRIFDILQYVAAQSTPKPHPPQPQQQATRVTPNKKSTVIEEPPSPTSSESLSEKEEEEVTLNPPKSNSESSLQKSISSPAAVETLNPSSSKEIDKMEIEKTSSSSVIENDKPLVQETVIEEAIKATRGGLRKKRSISNAK